MRSLYKIIVSIIILSLSFAFVGCDSDTNESAPKPSFETALNNTASAEVKQFGTKFNAAFIFYDNAGKPCRIEEQLTLNRKDDGTVQMLYGELETVELSEYAAAFLSAINALQPLGEVYRFARNETYIAARAALYDDTANGQVRLCEIDSEPVFEFAEDSSDLLEFEGAWGAVKYSDFVTFKNDIEIEPVQEVDVLDVVFSPLVLPLDWTTVTDNADGKTTTINGQKLYSYDLVFSSDDVIEYAKSLIVEYIDILLKEDDPEAYEEVMGLYERYVDMFVSMLTVQNYRIIAYADENGRLISQDTTFGLKFIISDSQIVTILRNEGVDEEFIGTVEDLLPIIHTFLTNSTNEKGKFEFELLLSLSETFDYTQFEYDLDDEIFASFDEDYPQRVIASVYYDDEREGYRWTTENIPDFPEREDEEDETNPNDNPNQTPDEANTDTQE